MEKNHLRLMMAMALLIAAWITMPAKAFAQEMVTAVADNGLEKTISYDVSKFTDIRDKKLEDVMKKMPGLSVMSFDGTNWVDYNGMGIDKIYVNGLDMLEGNYQPVYDMKPEDVERLEITENHVSVKIMKGSQYSSSASINVILKESASAKWTGAVKGGLGFKPLLLNADFSALNIGKKIQTTINFKADNTGLDFSGGLTGFGGDMYYMDNNASENNGGGFNFSIKQFLNIQPSLAPLSSDRVRFNRSAIANIGSTIKLSNDYQLNLQLTYHTDRLTASSMDETTYYLDKGEKVVDVVGENAKTKRHDVQADMTLLANTERKYLRNKLSFATQWNDITKSITGSFPNSQLAKTTPLFIKNDFLYKHPIGKNILSLNANIGFYVRPQDLNVDRETVIYSQYIKSNSSYFDLGARFDISLTDQLKLALRGGMAGNARSLEVDLSPLPDEGIMAPNINTQVKVFNGYASAGLTYITDKMQAALTLPLKYGNYNMEDSHSSIDMNKSKFYFSPSLSVKYEASQNLSLSLRASYNANEISRASLYPHLILNDFRTATQGLPDMLADKSGNIEFAFSYKYPEKSFFLNGSINHSRNKEVFVPLMDFSDAFIITGQKVMPHNTQNTFIMADASKGITSLKGKIGLSANLMTGKSSMVRNDALIPYTSTMLELSPYINGRINSWWNVVYKLNLNFSSMKMEDEDTTSKSKGYTQTLEMIFSPWKKLNFSLLGEHYYTEFTDDVSKHLALLDFKAEYNINEKWQLILSAKNILNQKTYNYTLVDSERFTKSYTAYEIRPRNILLSLYYKF